MKYPIRIKLNIKYPIAKVHLNKVYEIERKGLNEKTLTLIEGTLYKYKTEQIDLGNIPNTWVTPVVVFLDFDSWYRSAQVKPSRLTLRKAWNAAIENYKLLQEAQNEQEV